MDTDVMEQILEDIVAFGEKYPLIRVGDITGAFLRTKGVSRPADWMLNRCKEHPDKLERLQVVDRPGSHRWFWVLRRKV